MFYIKKSANPITNQQKQQQLLSLIWQVSLGYVRKSHLNCKLVFLSGHHASSKPARFLSTVWNLISPAGSIVEMKLRKQLIFKFGVQLLLWAHDVFVAFEIKSSRWVGIQAGGWVLCKIKLVLRQKVFHNFVGDLICKTNEDKFIKLGWLGTLSAVEHESRKHEVPIFKYIVTNTVRKAQILMVQIIKYIFLSTFQLLWPRIWQVHSVLSRVARST